MYIEYRKAVQSDTNLAVKMWTSHTAEDLADKFSAMIKNDKNVVCLLVIDNQIQGFAQCGLRYDYVEGTHSSPVGYPEGF